MGLFATDTSTPDMPRLAEQPLFWAVLLLLLAIVAASGYVWVRIVAGKRQALAEQPRNRAGWNPFVVAFVLLLTGYQLASRFNYEFKRWKRDAATSTDAPSSPAENKKQQSAPGEGNPLPAGEDGGESSRASRTTRQLLSVVILHAATAIVLLMLLTASGSTADARTGMPPPGLADRGVHTQTWRGDLRVGGVGFLASAGPVMLMLMLTARLRSPDTQHSMLKLVESNPGFETIVWVFVAAVVTAPLAEELLYRVGLQGWLQTRVQPWAAVAVSSLAFSAVHGWPDALAILPLAAVLGYVHLRQNSYLAVVIIHALFNLTNLVLALLIQAATRPV